MSNKIQGLLLISSIFLFTSAAQAQIRAEAGLAFAVGVPQAEFGEQIDNVGFGINLNGAIGISGLPVLVGADLGFFVYGHERRNEPFSNTIPDVTVRVVTDNNIVSGHFFVRIQPDQPVFRPYADALIGFKHLYTDTRITNDLFDETEIARSTNFDDTALSYGVGGGFQIRVFKGMSDDEPNAVFLDFGAKYLVGSEAGYLEEGSIRRENGRVTFEVLQSKTTILVPYLGVTVSF